MADKKMSFLPEDYVERRIEQRTNLLCLTLFAIVLCGVVGAYLVTNRHRAEVRANREQVNKSYAEAARRIEQVEKLQQQKQDMLKKAQVTATLIQKVPRTFLLAELVNRMPATLSLLDLQLTTKTEAVRITTKAPSENKSALANSGGKNSAKPEPPAPKTSASLALIGLAPTDVQVAQFMAALSQSRLVADVNLVFSEESRVEETTMRRFRIDMTLNDDADVRLIDPLKVPRKLKADPMKPLETAATKTAAPTLQTAGHPAAEN